MDDDIKWMECRDHMEVWDWIEDNCPSTSIRSISTQDGRSVMQVEFGSDMDRVLFLLRWVGMTQSDTE